MKKNNLVFVFLFLVIVASAQRCQHVFTLGDNSFLLVGKPFQMISGEIHYPRVPREAWRQRMRMAKAMGLNTIGTYVFWNVHEPQKGHYDFSGNNDIAAFVKEAKAEGLWVILRPSTYVCAEWEFGGYPYRLQNEKRLIVRSKEAAYVKAYRNYIMEVGKQLAPLQVNHGGTTRAFMNGANYNDKNPYEPQISSYDYDAPLDEAENTTEKFMQFREVTTKHLPAGETLPPVPVTKKSIALNNIHFIQSVTVLDLLLF